MSKDSRRYLREFDDTLHILTGKRLKDIGARAVDIFGEEIMNFITRERPVALSPENPYNILEVRPGASDRVVKWAYRAQAHYYHPDNKETGNPEMFKQIQAAYEKIMAERSPAAQR